MAKERHIRWKFNKEKWEQIEADINNVHPLDFLKDFIEYPHYPEDDVLNDDSFAEELGAHIIEKVKEDEDRGMVRYVATFKIKS